MRHAFIAAQLLGQAQAALAVEANEPLAQAGSTDHRLRHGPVWGASALLALGALATVVSGLT
jgi:hypothetical protein